MKQIEIDMLAESKKGLLTMCVGTGTGENIITSLQVAEKMAELDETANILYINTVMTPRQLGSEIRRHIDSDYSSETPNPQIRHVTLQPGKLNNAEIEIRTELGKGVRYIIVNSLEFSSRDSRRRDVLLFQIMEWLLEFGIGVMVFCERSNSIASHGHIQRGGIGKYAGLAANINYLSDIENEGYRLDPNDGENTWAISVREREEEILQLEREEQKRIQSEADAAEEKRVREREKKFLEADVPIIHCENPNGVKAVIEAFRRSYVEFYKGRFESKEHYRKRILAAAAVHHESNPKFFGLPEDNYGELTIVHSSDTNKLFEEETLPEGRSFKDYYKPDKLPIAGIRKPKVHAKS